MANRAGRETELLNSFSQSLCCSMTFRAAMERSGRTRCVEPLVGREMSEKDAGY